MGAVILMPALSPTMTEGKLARWLTVALTIGTVAGAMILVLLVIRSITKPVQNCVDSLQRLAQKDLTPR